MLNTLLLLIGSIILEFIHLLLIVSNYTETITETSRQTVTHSVCTMDGYIFFLLIIAIAKTDPELRPNCTSSKQYFKYASYTNIY